jgi:hypothetical protein
MSMDFIRRTDGLKCKRGDRVRFSPPGKPVQDGTILSARFSHLRIRMDDGKAGLYHPTWCLAHLGGAEA